MSFGQTYKYRRARKTRRTRRIIRRRAQHSGGNPQFLGKGSYGCVYRPAFTCASPPPLSPYASPEEAAARNSLIRSRKIHAGKIGKLTTPNEAENEMSIASILKKIDPEQDLFLYGLDSCQINPAELRQAANYSPEVKRCIEGEWNPLRKITPETAVQVFMKYGGRDMVHLDSSLATNATGLFESIVDLFNGLMLLHKNNLVHLDFKLQNIVFRRESGDYNPYIIDFGMMSPTHKIYRRHSNMDWGMVLYAPYPPDICLLDRRLISKTAREVPAAAAANSPVIRPKSEVINEYINVYLKTKFVNSIESNLNNGIKH